MNATAAHRNPRLKTDSRKMIPLDVAMTTFGLDYRHHRPTSDGRTEYFGPCPRPGCKADKDGFSIRETSSGLMWDCHQCRNSGGVGRGGWYVDHLLQELGMWAVLDRCGVLEDGSAPRTPYPIRPVENRKVEIPKEPTFEELLNSPISFERIEEMRTAEAKKKMGAHLASYNITYACVDRYLLGYASDVKPWECAIPAGFTFPNISLGPGGKRAIRGLSIRRDDEICGQILLDRGKPWLDEAHSNLFKAWFERWEKGERPELRDPAIEDLIDLEWAKYKGFKGSQHGIWNDELVTLPDKSRMGPSLGQIFIVEGARDALALLQLGYPAVAFEERNDWLFWLPRVFQNVDSIWIVADRDEQWNNLDAGRNHALKVKTALDVGQAKFGYDTQIVIPPHGIDDVSSMCRREGRYGLGKWVEEITSGVKPELQPMD